MEYNEQGLRAELHRSPNDGRWRWKAVARNGEPVAIGEPTFSKFNARRSVRRAFPGIPVVTIR